MSFKTGFIIYLLCKNVASVLLYDFIFSPSIIWLSGVVINAATKWNLPLSRPSVWCASPNLNPISMKDVCHKTMA